MKSIKTSNKCEEEEDCAKNFEDCAKICEDMTTFYEDWQRSVMILPRFVTNV